MVSKNNAMSFEEAFQKLETLVEKLEGGESTLDEAMQAFEEGMVLVSVCSKKLEAAETRLQELVQKDDGGFRLEPTE